MIGLIFGESDFPIQILKKIKKKKLKYLLIDLTKRKKDTARNLFILAQCLREIGETEAAIETFNDVVDLRTPYELEFQVDCNTYKFFIAGAFSSELYRASGGGQHFFFFRL